MRGRGVEIHTRTKVARIEKDPREGYSVFTEIGQEISADLVMYATGRGPNTKGLGLAEIGIETRRQRRRRRRRMAAQQRAEYLRGRRRDRPAQSDAGRDRRGPRDRRDLVQQQPDQDGPRRCADRGVQQPADRHGRADRGTGAPAIRRRCRCLCRALPADEEHAVGARGAHADEAGRRCAAPTGCSAATCWARTRPRSSRASRSRSKAGATKRMFDQTVGIHPSAAEEFVTMREKTVRPQKQAAE